MSTRLFLIRHGETEWNQEGRLQGVRDSALTSRGTKESTATRDALVGVEFSTLYTSDLGRAIATADILAEGRRVERRVDVRLREISYGILEGLAWADIEARHPEIARSLERRRAEYAPPGGESRRMLVDRASEVVTEIARAHPRQTVVIVTHGGFLAAFCRSVLQIPLETPSNLRAANCSMNVFSYASGRFHLIRWGIVDHLAALSNLSGSD